MQAAHAAVFGGDGDGVAFDAARRAPRNGPLFDVVAQAALGFPGGLFGFFLVTDVDKGFEDGLEFSFGDVIDERVDDEAVFAQV